MRILVAFLFVFLISCDTKNTPANESANNKPEKLTLSDMSNKKDPVCEMSLEHVGDTTLYNGKIIGFCSSECKSDFVKDPSKYIAKAELK